jgi:hypothetical protein
MKKILFIFIIYFASIVYSSAEQKCNELPGFKKLGKDSIEYVKCLKKSAKKSGKFKLKTESKLTNWIKKKINNPLIKKENK